jgi:hypothetical protein
MLVQVVHDGDQPTEGDELLSSFNVATFKQDVDDAAFWNRLIPVTERPKAQPSKAPEELGTRSTRYHRGDDVCPSSHLLASSQCLPERLQSQDVKAVPLSSKGVRMLLTDIL